MALGYSLGLMGSVMKENGELESNMVQAYNMKIMENLEEVNGSMEKDSNGIMIEYKIKLISIYLQLSFIRHKQVGIYTKNEHYLIF